MLMLTCPTSYPGYTRTTTQLKALQSRISKMKNYEKCWPHRCMHRTRRKFRFFFKTQASGKPEAKIMQRRGASANRI